MKPIQVDWIDAEDKSPWYDKEETSRFFNEKPIVHSVGFLFVKNDDWIGIVGDWSEEKNPDYGRLLKIPRQMVLKMSKL